MLDNLSTRLDKLIKLQDPFVTSSWRSRACLGGARHPAAMPPVMLSNALSGGLPADPLAVYAANVSKYNCVVPAGAAGEHNAARPMTSAMAPSDFSHPIPRVADQHAEKLVASGTAGYDRPMVGVDGSQARHASGVADAALSSPRSMRRQQTKAVWNPLRARHVWRWRRHSRSA
jgi:hypothetical protein